jgi:hypothetical protein
MRNFGYDELGLDKRRVMGSRLKFLDMHDRAVEWAFQNNFIDDESRSKI